MINRYRPGSKYCLTGFQTEEFRCLEKRIVVMQRKEAYGHKLRGKSLESMNGLVAWLA
jgi:hypothetical protein